MNIPKKNQWKPSIIKALLVVNGHHILNRFIFINVKTLKKIVLGVLFVAMLIWLGSHDPSQSMNEKYKKPESLGIMY